jgi:dienelactone hydrolase
MTTMSRRQLFLAATAVVASRNHVAAQHPGAHGNVRGRPAISGFATETFRHSGRARQVYIAGEGMPVLLLHELPGMSWATVLLAQRLADRGFRVYVPRLFGGVGQSNGFKGTLQSCFGPDWDCSDPNGTSRILTWIHALAADIGARQRTRMGAIGMCLTGAFPLALMDIPQMFAGVLSQPALPLRAGTPERLKALGLSSTEISRAVERKDAEFFALRFSADKLCQKERFETLETLFSARLETVVIPSGPGTQLPGDAHAVLTGWYDASPGSPTRQAFEKVVEFLMRMLHA